MGVNAKFIETTKAANIIVFSLSYYASSFEIVFYFSRRLPSKFLISF